LARKSQLKGNPKKEEKLMKEQQWVGIDVCQRYLDVYIRPVGKIHQFSNDERGIAQLVECLRAMQPELIVLEATGGLKVEAAMELDQASLPVAVINPRQSRDFAFIDRAVSEDRCD
jgi:transposase